MNETINKEITIPTVEMPSTICWITDRKPATVIAVSPTAAKVTVREDKATRTDGNGMSESQSYTYERDPVGALHVFHRQANGTYRSPGKCLVLGARHCYHDYSY
jgi:hypothetical protein